MGGACVRPVGAYTNDHIQGSKDEHWLDSKGYTLIVMGPWDKDIPISSKEVLLSHSLVPHWTPSKEKRGNSVTRVKAKGNLVAPSIRELLDQHYVQ